MRNRIRHHAMNALALALFFATYVFIGTMEFDAMDDERYIECAEMLAQGDWDGASCAGEWDDLSAIARSMWGPDGDPETTHRTDCGMVREEREWVPASCASPAEIAQQMDRIRSRGNEREWVAFGTDAR